MKSMKHLLKTLFLVICITLLFTAFTSAEEVTPEPETTQETEPAAEPIRIGTVKRFEAKLSGTSVTLTWNAVADAKNYVVYSVKTSNGKVIKELKRLSGSTTTVKFSGLKEALTYSYRVAVIGKNGTTSELSGIASVTVPSKKPTTPGSFYISSYGSKSVYLHWSRVSGVNGYGVFIYNKKTGEYELAKTCASTESTLQVGGLKLNREYRMVLKSYRLVNGVKVFSNPSSEVTFTLTDDNKAVSKVRSPRYTATAKKRIVAQDAKTGKKIVIKAGEKVTVTSKSSGKVTAYTTAGKRVYIYGSSVKIYGLDSSKENDYSNKTKELYVNGRGFSSNTGWFIWVSEYKFKINIYSGSKGNWKLQKVYPCCSGAWNARTAGGLQRILKKVYYGQYGAPHIWFSPGIAKGGTASDPQGCAFHKYTSSDRDAAVSHGCVRTSNEALYYIYNHCPVGTPVYVH